MSFALALIAVLAATTTGPAPLAAPAGAAAIDWVLALPDTALLGGPAVSLGDLNQEPLPAAAAALLLLGDGRPGQTVVLDRRVVLRRLVEAGLAAGVARCAGAERCAVVFTGRGVNAAQVRARVGELLAPLQPAPRPGAPATWLEVELRVPPLPGDAWTAELVEPHPLRPGRNLVGVRVAGGGRAARLTASVVCHVYDEIATARSALPTGTPLAPDQFGWEWRDLTTVPPGLVVGRDAVGGRSSASPLRSGEPLRLADLKPTPLVRQGDPVELTVRRGAVVVTVRGTARQDGTDGQMITVRNDMNGKLATGRVVGPGQVEWRR